MTIEMSFAMWGLAGAAAGLGAGATLAFAWALPKVVSGCSRSTAGLEALLGDVFQRLQAQRAAENTGMQLPMLGQMVRGLRGQGSLGAPMGVSAGGASDVELLNQPTMPFLPASDRMDFTGGFGGLGGVEVMGPMLLGDDDDAEGDEGPEEGTTSNAHTA